MARLGDEEIAAGLAGVEWRRDGEVIVRDLAFPDFAAAIAFVVRVADAAEAAAHHPDIRLHAYRRVELRLTDHDAGGISEKDLALATTIDGLTGLADGDVGASA